MKILTREEGEEPAVDSTKLCRICGKLVKAKGLCAKHHQRMRRTGSVDGKNESVPLKVESERARSWPQNVMEGLLHDIQTKRTDIRIPSQKSDEDGGIMEKHRSISIVRKIDSLGRFVLPKEYSIFHGALTGLPMEFFLDGQAIVLQVYNPGCYFCGSVANMMVFKERKICRSCINGLTEETRHDGH